jgi:hypothetical protein
MISATTVFAKNVTVKVTKMYKPVALAYVKQIGPKRWELRYGPPSNPTGGDIIINSQEAQDGFM